jgi:hypothetical protein
MQGYCKHQENENESEWLAETSVQTVPQSAHQLSVKKILKKLNCEF